MILYARIDADRVAELLRVDGAPPLEERYHPDIVATCVPLTAAQAGTVRAGDLYDGTTFTSPPEPAAFTFRVITPREFRLRFTTAERSAITLAASRALEAGDASLQVFLDDCSAASEIELDHPDLTAGVAALVTAGLISQTRATAILA